MMEEGCYWFHILIPEALMLTRNYLVFWILPAAQK